MTRPAETLELAAHPAHHAAVAFITGHLVAILLILGALFVGLLALPVLGDAIFGSVQAPAMKSGRVLAVAGAGVLIVGLIAGVPILAIIGAALIGAVAVGWLLVYY
jgi:hypothetical protein